MERKKFSTNTYWEPIIGYSRAICIGQYIHVSGTTSTDENGNIIGNGDPYQQTIQIIHKIQTALQYFEADLNDIVRTRIYLANMDNWQDVGRAHSEYFREIRPACTLIEINRLIDSELLVEIEVDAFIDK